MTITNTEGLSDHSQDDMGNPDNWRQGFYSPSQGDYFQGMIWIGAVANSLPYSAPPEGTGGHYPTPPSLMHPVTSIHQRDAIEALIEKLEAAAEIVGNPKTNTEDRWYKGEHSAYKNAAALARTALAGIPYGLPALSRRAANSAGGVEPDFYAVWNGRTHIGTWQDAETASEVAADPDYSEARVVPLFTHPSSPVSAEVTETRPDHCYDPDDWEYSMPWEDRNELVEQWEPNKVHRVATLIDGPDRWVVLFWDEENGEEIRWFDTEAEPAALLAALNGKE